MKNSKGFTLIELLVVIAIIGLLSTLAVIALNSARAKSRDSKRVSDIKQVQTALELYYADQNGYPQQTALFLGGYSGMGSNVLQGNGFAGTGSGTGTVYMGQVPKAPTPADNATGTTCTSNAIGVSGNNYIYNYVSATASYTIDFCLGATTGDLQAGLRRATPNGIQ